MNGASKILTVSYGTFSCTLEGFEEPFNTMKAIAEYFRDLAADDRYFGAEPPTPDAAMLQRIAEREIQRRVEAKIQDNGLILRAEGSVTPKVTMPAPQHTPAPVPVPVLATVAEAAAAVESAATRLSRLRAAQSQIIAPAPVLSDLSARFADVEAYAEDQEAEVKPSAAAIRLIEPTAQPGPATLVVTVAAPAEAQPMPSPAPAERIETATQPAPIAEIPAAVEALPDAAAPTLPEPQPGAAAPDAIAAAVRETLAGLIDEDDQLVQDIAETAPQTDDRPDDFEEDPTLAAETPRPSTAYFDISDQFDASDASAPVDAFPEIEPEIGDEAHSAELLALDGATLTDDDFLGEDDFAEAETAADLNDNTDQSAAETLADPGVATLPEISRESARPPQAPPAAEVVEKLQRARARVIKIRRLDTMPQAAAQPVPVPAPLSAEAEAALQSELAALEAEIAPVKGLSTAEPAESIADQAADEPAAIAAEHATAEPQYVTASPQADDVLPLAAEPPASETHKLPESVADEAERLLAQTNTALEVPESKRRRSAIAHLKAAVLATVAERRINPNAVKQEAAVRMDPYRKDLDKVMRPVDPGSVADRPAPLVLVSAQRIDRKKDAVLDPLRPMPQIVPSVAPLMVLQPATSQPVRPRRVTSGSLAMQDDASDDEDGALAPEDMDNIFTDGKKQSFAEFADSLGATSMGELIEAAGAYCTLVLGRPSFTRPLLFQQISAMPKLADRNREDTLRGFGRLLRDGRIQKTRRGQFELAEASPILIEAKRIAG